MIGVHISACTSGTVSFGGWNGSKFGVYDITGKSSIILDTSEKDNDEVES